MTSHREHGEDVGIPLAPGVHRWLPGATEAGAEAALRRAASEGRRATALDLTAVVDKETFLAECARALDLPGWFGGTWDSLYDCLIDLSWWGTPRGYLIVARGWHALERNAPGLTGTPAGIAEDATAHWLSRATPMTVLLG
ncbi:barstar family protein [Streptomyces radicis]|nr:barstar family protein [Streptomyces radicis]